MYRSNLKVSATEANHTKSMEHAIWKVNTGTMTIESLQSIIHHIQILTGAQMQCSLMT